MKAALAALTSDELVRELTDRGAAELVHLGATLVLVLTPADQPFGPDDADMRARVTRIEARLAAERRRE